MLSQIGSTDDHLRRFNGKEFDTLSSLSYYGFRYYDSLSLSWSQADPLYRFTPDITFDEPRRMSLYVFSLNNPMRYTDPDGQNPAVAAEPAAIAGAAAGAFVIVYTSTMMNGGDNSEAYAQAVSAAHDASQSVIDSSIDAANFAVEHPIEIYSIMTVNPTVYAAKKVINALTEKKVDLNLAEKRAAAHAQVSKAMESRKKKQQYDKDKDADTNLDELLDNEARVKGNNEDEEGESLGRDDQTHDKSAQKAKYNRNHPYIDPAFHAPQQRLICQ